MSKLIIPLIFILLGFFVSLKTLLSPFSFGDMDAYARANWGYDKYQDGQLLNLLQSGGAWLPFHSNIMGFSILLFKDPQLSPRIISLILNVISIPMMYVYTKMVFKKEITAIVAGIIYLVHPLRVLLATQPLSETISMLFILLLLVLCFSKNVKSLFIILLINIACAIRYEFWLMIPFIYFTILANKRSNSIQLLFYAFLCSAFPILWISANYLQSGDPIWFFSLKYQNAQTPFPEVPYYNFFLATKAWFNLLIDQIGFFGFFLVFYGSLKDFHQKEQLSLKKSVAVLFPALFFLSLVFQVFLGTMELLVPRYLFMVVVGIIPLYSYGLTLSVESVLKQKNNYISVALLISFFVLYSLEVSGMTKNIENWKHTISNIELSRVVELSDYYKNNASKFKKISYISNNDWLFPMFTYLTQRHDISFITTDEYFSEIPNGQIVTIVAKPPDSFHCQKESTVINDSFILCF